MSTPRRKFDKDFKEEAVKMVLEGGLKRSEVGRRLGVNQTMIGNWVRAFQVDQGGAFRGNGRLTPQDEKIRILEKKVKDQAQELEFLKKKRSVLCEPKEVMFAAIDVITPSV